MLSAIAHAFAPATVAPSGPPRCTGPVARQALGATRGVAIARGAAKLAMAIIPVIPGWALNGLTQIYGYGSIPINTIFRGMNIHKSQLFWCELQGYKVLTHCHIHMAKLCTCGNSKKKLGKKHEYPYFEHGTWSQNLGTPRIRGWKHSQ